MDSVIDFHIKFIEFVLWSVMMLPQMQFLSFQDENVQSKIHLDKLDSTYKKILKEYIEFQWYFCNVTHYIVQNGEYDVDACAEQWMQSVVNGQ